MQVILVVGLLVLVSTHQPSELHFRMGIPVVIRLSVPWLATILARWIERSRRIATPNPRPIRIIDAIDFRGVGIIVQYRPGGGHPSGQGPHMLLQFPDSDSKTEPCMGTRQGTSFSGFRCAEFDNDVRDKRQDQQESDAHQRESQNQGKTTLPVLQVMSNSPSLKTITHSTFLILSENIGNHQARMPQKAQDTSPTKMRRAK